MAEMGPGSFHCPPSLTEPIAFSLLDLHLNLLCPSGPFAGELSNPFPTLVTSASSPDSPLPLDDPSLDGLRDELFSLVRRIQDPEHRLSLEQLGVVRKAHISFHPVDEAPHEPAREAEVSGAADEAVVALVEFTPTVPHCSLATTIGLCIRTKVQSTIPDLKVRRPAAILSFPHPPHIEG
jgi:metal-sulfur cluster biosynthetic enzyme